MDFGRIKTAIIIPFLSGESSRYIAFDPHTAKYIDKGEVNSRLLIIEGSYSQHPELSSYYYDKIFIDISEEEQKKRLIARERENFETFTSLWI